MDNDRTIPKVKSASGEILIPPKDINSRFQQFYECLYASHKTVGVSSIQEFLNLCNLPSLSETEATTLGAPVTTQEIRK